MNRRNTSLFGYTYIELVLVMAILAILGSLFISTFPASQRRSRDARRKSDLNQYRVALENYANSNSSFYPSRNNVSAHTTLCTSDLGLSSGDCPADPKDGDNDCEGLLCRYLYQSNNCGSAGDACATNYILYAAVEEAENNLEYFVYCSNGQSGYVDSTAVPPSTPGSCPL